MLKIQNSFEYLDFEHYDLFGIWCFGFVIFIFII